MGLLEDEVVVLFEPLDDLPESLVAHVLVVREECSGVPREAGVVTPERPVDEIVKHPEGYQTTIVRGSTAGG